MTTDIIIDVDQKLIRLPHNKNELEIFETEKFENGGKYVKYKTDIRLLKRLLLGPRYAHWNNAEIGSHIFFSEIQMYLIEMFIKVCATFTTKCDLLKLRLKTLIFF